MTKTQDISAFADSMIAIIRSSGATVDLSRTSRTTRTAAVKPLLYLNNSGTTWREQKVRLAETRTSSAVATRTGKSSAMHGFTGDGTSGTAGTIEFTADEDRGECGAAPPEWHAILAELKVQECPDWLTADRWRGMLSAAEIFLTRWGSAAHLFGWTAHDVFGVHPTAPAARFDVMGLLLLIQGGAVVGLTADGASIRRASGAVLSYRPCVAPGGILLSELRS